VSELAATLAPFGTAQARASSARIAKVLATRCWRSVRRCRGTTLKLVDNRTPGSADCTWTYRGGMFFSDSNPTLAINAYGGAQHGTMLKLVDHCTPGNADCTWTYRNVRIVSESNAGLAMNAFAGAQHQSVLKIVNNSSSSTIAAPALRIAPARTARGCSSATRTPAWP
jgi:hypothetical protein